MAAPQDTSIWMPLDLIRKSPGLGLDFGGSTLKIAYRDSRCFRNGEPTSTEVESSLKLAIFPIHNVEENLRFIKEHVDVTRNEKGEANISCTGVNGMNYMKSLKEEQNINLQILIEFDCFCVAFKVLSANLKEKDFLQPLPMKAFEKGQEVRRDLTTWLDGSKHLLGNIEFHGFSGEKREEEKNMLPCIIVIAGSAFSFMKINSNGSYTLLDCIYPGGATFVGMAHEMTRMQEEFDEVMEQVSSTDGRSVDLYASELSRPPPGEEYPLYNWHGIDINVFPFAKIGGNKSGNLHRKDVLNSLFNHYCVYLSHIARLNARVANVKTVYFCGNFVNSDVARFNIIRALLAHATHIYNPAVGEEEDYQFPKHGGCFGAIGCFFY